jgi:hypothetical protein
MCLQSVINPVLMGADPMTDDFRSSPLPLSSYAYIMIIYLFETKIKFKKITFLSLVSISLRVTAISQESFVNFNEQAIVYDWSMVLYVFSVPIFFTEQWQVSRYQRLVRYYRPWDRSLCIFHTSSWAHSDSVQREPGALHSRDKKADGASTWSLTSTTAEAKKADATRANKKKVKLSP